MQTQVHYGMRVEVIDRDDPYFGEQGSVGPAYGNLESIPSGTLCSKPNAGPPYLAVYVSGVQKPKKTAKAQGKEAAPKRFQVTRIYAPSQLRGL